MVVFDDNDNVIDNIFSPRYRMPKAKPSPRGMTISGRGIKHDVDRRPTKQEAYDKLWLGLPKPLRPAIRSLSPTKKPGKPSPILIPFYAFELAEFLIELDPLDRIQD